MPHSSIIYDLSWRRGDLAAMLAICTIAAAALLGQVVGGRRLLGDDIPVDRQRVASAAERIDPNTATFASLLRLPRIGPGKARAIMDYRRAHPESPFVSAADLQRVRGIGPGIVTHIEPYLVDFGRQ